MRGDEGQEDDLFCYDSLESRIPSDHPLRPIRKMVDQALRNLSPEFQRMYSKVGRPSIPPERLLRALLIQVLYSIRSERLLVEQLDYNLLFRWFVGLSISGPVWNHATFSKNRDRLMESEISTKFFQQIKDQAEQSGLLSDEHFSVDGTLIEAWASMKSFKPKDQSDSPPPPGGRNPEVNFRGQKRKNTTHQSTTDPDARLFKKSTGSASKLCFMGHVLMENRNGLVVDTRLTLATGKAEREAAKSMIRDVPGSHFITVGGDKNYDTRDFIHTLRELRATPHVAKRKHSTIDGRTTRHPGYCVSQKVRKRAEEIFGWMKTIGPLRKSTHIGKRKVAWNFTFIAAVFNLVRMRNICYGSSP
jgi:transposase